MKTFINQSTLIPKFVFKVKEDKDEQKLNNQIFLAKTRLCKTHNLRFDDLIVSVGYSGNDFIEDKLTVVIKKRSI